MDKQVETLVLNEMNDADVPAAPALLAPDLSLIGHLETEAVVEVGRVDVSVEKLFSLKRGDVLCLREAANAPVLLCVAGKVIAKGYLVAVGDKFGFEVVELAK